MVFDKKMITITLIAVLLPSLPVILPVFLSPAVKGTTMLVETMAVYILIFIELRRKPYDERNLYILLLSISSVFFITVVYNYDIPNYALTLNASLALLFFSYFYSSYIIASKIFRNVILQLIFTIGFTVFILSFFFSLAGLILASFAFGSQNDNLWKLSQTYLNIGVNSLGGALAALASLVAPRFGDERREDKTKEQH